MSEWGFGIFHQAAACVEVLLSAVCMSVFFRTFMPASGRRGLPVFLIYAGVYFTHFLLPHPVGGWICMPVVAALSQAVPAIAGMGRRKVFLLEAIFFSIRYGCVLIGQSLHYIMDRCVVETAGSPEAVFLGAAAVFSAVMAVRFLLLGLLLYVVARILPVGDADLQGKELCYLCLIPMAGILSGYIVMRLFVVVKDGVFFRMYEQYPIFIGLLPLAVVLSYAGILVTIASYRQVAGLQEEKRKCFVEERQLSALRERMEEVEQFYGGINRMKHEMRNHLTNIRGLAVRGEYREMEEYISRIYESMEAFELSVKTGNAVTDVIVNDKLKAAQKAGIRFRAEFAYPDSEGYDAYDIGIILHNLLQNALEACERMTDGNGKAVPGRYIALSGRRKRKFFLIEVRNSFRGDVIFDERRHLPVSTKGGEAFLHGIGLSNVRREAAKYMGDVDIRAEGEEFCATVLLHRKEGT